MYCRVNWMSTDVSEVRAASIIALMMEAARTSETSVDIQLRTRQYNPQNSELHTRRRETLKRHFVQIFRSCESSCNWNVGRYSVKNTAVQPTKFWASYSPPWELETSLCTNI
jgi:hypothetical protein